MNITNIFGIEITNIKKLFCDDQEKCFYIPAYQRPYSWDKSPVDRMWEDVVYGLKQLESSDDYITFLGSIITMHDSEHKSISPIVRTEVPSKVMVIIDGQQRLSTLLLLIIALDNEARRRISKNNEKLLIKLLDILPIVSRAYKSPKNFGLDDKEDYPKLIRAYDDQWSTGDTKKYESPMAKLLKQYIDFTKGDSNKRKKFIFDISGTNNENYIVVKQNIAQFQKRIDKFLKEDIAVHDILIKNTKLLDIAEELINEEILSGEGKDVVILVLVLRYVLYRVFVAEITAKKEDYAFEMFDSLNTTGDPLTAFETFKPYVVQYESLERYEISDSKIYMDKIEDFLQENPRSRNSITSRLITAFALSENGEKLSNKLRDQRIFLRGLWNESNDKKGFVKNLADISKFYSLWNSPNLAQEIEDREVVTALQFLISSKHTISIPILAGFYKKDSDKEDFYDAVKAIAAFFGLWRSIRSGTSGIDTCYRNLMLKGLPLPYCKGNDGVDIQQELIRPFNRTNGKLSINSLKIALRYYLYKGANDGAEIYSLESWSKKLKVSEIYHNKDIAKFLLIAGLHDVTSSDTGIGHIQEARPGLCPTLDKFFNYNFFESIEHISPQSTKWEGVSDERVHVLGNLTLLPMRQNASVGNRSLEEKELMFKALSARTTNEQNELLKKSKVKFVETTQDILSESQHFPHLESLTNLSGWNDKVIESRTNNLGGMIWKRLAINWLGFDN